MRAALFGFIAFLGLANLSFAEETTSGYKIISTEKGSAFESLGLKAGDTIVSINEKKSQLHLIKLRAHRQPWGGRTGRN